MVYYLDKDNKLVYEDNNINYEKPYENYKNCFDLSQDYLVYKHKDFGYKIINLNDGKFN